MWYVLGLPHFLRVYARLAFYRLRVWIGFNIAVRRRNEADKLMDLVGLVFKETTLLFSAVSLGLTDKPGYDPQQDYKEERTICWETPIAILVYLAGRPALALGVELRGKALCIRQMQGAPNIVLPKALRDWPRLFIVACMEMVEQLRLREVRIYCADQNLSYHYPVLNVPKGQTRDAVEKEHRRRMRRRYDGTARQMKFEKRKKYWVWKNPRA